MIKPLRGRILARVIPREEKTKSGLTVVSLRKDIPERVKVLKVGESEIGKKGKPIKSYAHEGGILYIKKYSGDRLKIDGEDLVIIKNEHIVGRV